MATRDRGCDDVIVGFYPSSSTHKPDLCSFLKNALKRYVERAATISRELKPELQAATPEFN
ncbi:MAG: hypothetical protein ACFB0G_08720 [Leptolyngbyaceae cyanobacterium]